MQLMPPIKLHLSNVSRQHGEAVEVAPIGLCRPESAHPAVWKQNASIPRLLHSTQATKLPVALIDFRDDPKMMKKNLEPPQGDDKGKT